MLSQILLALAAVQAQQQKYIVKLKESSASTLVKRGTDELQLDWVNDILAKHDAESSSFDESPVSAMSFQYNFNGFLGFAVSTGASAIEEIAKNPSVEYWSYDNPLTLNAPIETAAAPEVARSWGLDRIDQRSLPLNNEFLAPEGAGEGVTVYVIDTGIVVGHPEFEGRAVGGPSFVNGVFTAAPASAVDNNGHGTHCAGTIASKTYGIAKKANIVALTVFGATEGGDAGVIAAVQYAARNV